MKRVKGGAQKQLGRKTTKLKESTSAMKSTENFFARTSEHVNVRIQGN